MKDIKRIDIKEFREKGYLQEVNRRFFHPLGLALEIQEHDGTETLGGVWDSREDAEGIYYNLAESDEERKSQFKKNKDFIDAELNSRIAIRGKLLGFGIEPAD